jgi:uncharacterized protein YodC (DUF2158 family)
MSEHRYKSGDVVRLASGGPAMTVLEYEEDACTYEDDGETLPGVMCIWFADRVEVEEHTFAEEVLVAGYRAEDVP